MWMTQVPISDLSKRIFGKMFADEGYISHQMFIKLYGKGLEIITRVRKNMKNKLISQVGKILLRK
ncbi:hypothetical protein NEOC65_002364 [Neochlamydia sp. AcF65]|nr:transposase [Neochlamydia sp. AcF95]MBS4167258.1 hypothetical protein [Neochlamydia sp. AcF65]MBS4169672.1 hypothetical protein [Neochlamydia sp. AcF95]NGY95174.1 hypothetical protein [Neochlamydia sp. AcF84]